MIDIKNIQIGTIEMETKMSVPQGYATFVTLLIFKTEHHSLPTGLEWKRHKMK